jgi:hypothetical protein
VKDSERNQPLIRVALNNQVDIKSQSSIVAMWSALSLKQIANNHLHNRQYINYSSKHNLNHTTNWTSWVYLFPCKRFHVLLNSLFKVLCNFPSRYLFAIGLTVIFSFRWSLPPALGCTLKQPDSTMMFLCNARSTPRGFHPLWLMKLIQKHSRWTSHAMMEHHKRGTVLIPEY